MRFLPTRIHGIIDYLWGVALIAAPFLLGFADGGAAQWTATLFGLAAILYSAATAYEMGVVPLLPMPAHLAADGLGGLALAGAPWLLGFGGAARAVCVAFGLFSVVASLITRTRPA